MKRSPLVVIAATLSILLCAYLAGVGGCKVLAPGSTHSSANLASPEGQSDEKTSAFPVAISDDAGRMLKIQKRPLRIVSLSPGNTELLFAIGAGNNVVAGTESDDFPTEAKKLPHIGGFAASDLEKILVLKPDLVVSGGSLNTKLNQALETAKVQTLVLEPHTLLQVSNSIRLLGHATGHDIQANKVIETMNARIESVRKRAATFPARPTVLILYDVNPLYTSPTESFIHDLINVAGGRDVVEKTLSGNIISSEQVVLAKPDVIICGKYLENKVKAMPGWKSIPAVKNDRFFHSTDESVLVRPSPRLAQGVEELANYLHPSK